MNKILVWLGAICGLLGLAAFFSQTAVVYGATLPNGFSDSLVASIGSPTAMAFTPDGRLLVTTQSGSIRLIQNDSLVVTPALTISTICSDFERGLLGIEIDPNFASNHFIYVYYTSNARANSCARNDPVNSPMNRVSRFTMSGNTIAGNTELVLLDNIPSPNGNHNAGDLHFGTDGYLYISAGDGGCQLWNSGLCAGQNANARSKSILSGKILRIDVNSNPPGKPPATNPFFNDNGARRCGDPAVAYSDTGATCQETYSWGLRNPFRFTFKPGTTTMYINDVGQDTWEEIDAGQAGADYGWNVREGHCANGSTSNCGAPPNGLTNPIFDYQHLGCNSITGGAFVPANTWPAPYNNSYLYADYVCGKVAYLTQNGNTYTSTDFITGMGGSSAVTLLFGPYNNTQALYYTTYAAGGQIRRVAYTANTNPNAVISPTSKTGLPPLNVSFDGSASNDPDDNTPLSYIWNFGDGSPVVTTTLATTSHNYTVAGQYTATLTVRDSLSAFSNPANAVIKAGSAPQIAINQPVTTERFSVGQNITLAGSGTDVVDGQLPANSLCWVILLHHNEHTHPFLNQTCGNNLTAPTVPTAPAPEDLAATLTSYLEIQLTGTDSLGLSTVITQEYRPLLVTITLASAPNGTNLILNSTNISPTYTFVSWAGYALNVNAPDQTDSQSNSLTFSSWTDGGTQAHTITTPATPTTYVATFSSANCLPEVVTKRNDDGSCGTLSNAVSAANPGTGGGGVIGFVLTGPPGPVLVNTRISLPVGLVVAGNCLNRVSLSAALNNTQGILNLGNQSQLIGLNFQGTAGVNGQPLLISGKGIHFQCVKIVR